MRTRLVTAAFLLPVVAAVYFGPSWLFLALAVAAALLMARETLRLFEAGGSRPLHAPVLAGIAVVHAAFFAPRHLPVAAALALGVAACFACWMILRRETAGALAGVGAMVFVLAYPGLLMGFQVALRGLGDTGWGGGRVPALLVFLYASVFGGDAGAYFAGRAFGRIPLAPRISPKKTVEGLLGGIAGGVVLGVAFALALPTGLGAGRAALFGGLLAIAGAFGDLTKSLLKRSADVKDSGTLLPGHGGLLDRLDGLLVSSPLFYLLLTAPGVGLAAPE